MNKNNSEPVSSYQEYLPSILQEDTFIVRFLLAFEAILTVNAEVANSDVQIIQRDNSSPPGLEQIIDQIYLYFDPQETPEEFLPWLAGWVALSLRDDWDVSVKREFISQMTFLYRLRGTKAGLEQILGLYLRNSGFGDKVEIFDRFDYLPNYFQVQLTLNDSDPDKYWRQARIAKAIIDLEKPAHTFYSLRILTPTMRITTRSRLGYPFTLFDTPETQILTIEVKITPSEDNSTEMQWLADKLLINLTGYPANFDDYPAQITTAEGYFTKIFEINHQQYLDAREFLNITLSNQTDLPFEGIMTVNFYFNLNGMEMSNMLLQQSLTLSPVLKICRQNDALEIIEGSTIIHESSPQQSAGMQITQSIWSNPYTFTLFDDPETQELILKATVEINEYSTINSDLINLLTVRIQDSYSQIHLFTPETEIEDNIIRVRRKMTYQQFLHTQDSLQVTLKNLNQVEVTGNVIMEVELEINHQPSTYTLLSETFTLSAVPKHNILQICSQNDAGEIVDGNTIIGTATQSLS